MIALEAAREREKELREWQSTQKRNDRIWQVFLLMFGAFIGWVVKEASVHRGEEKPAVKVAPKGP